MFGEMGGYHTEEMTKGWFGRLKILNHVDDSAQGAQRK